MKGECGSCGAPAVTSYVLVMPAGGKYTAAHADTTWRACKDCEPVVKAGIWRLRLHASVTGEWKIEEQSTEAAA